MKKILLMSILMVLSFTLFSCSGTATNTESKYIDKLSTNAGMTKVSKFLEENNYNDGVEFVAESYSNNMEDSELVNSIISFRIKDGVLNFSVKEKDSMRTLYALDDSYFYNAKNHDIYVYDKTEMKNLMDNVVDNIKNLPETLSSFFDVEEVENGFSISFSKSLLYIISSQMSDSNVSLFSEKLLLTIKDDSLSLGVSIKAGTFSQSPLDTRPTYIQFKGSNHTYEKPHIEGSYSSLHSLDITPVLVKLEKFDNLFGALDNTQNLDNKHLRGHISEGLVRKNNSNLEVPFDINYCMVSDEDGKKNLNYSINIPLSYSYKNFDSSTYNDKKTKNETILNLLYDKPEPIRSYLGKKLLNECCEEINCEINETSVFLEAIKNKYDINIVFTSDSITTKFLMYSTDDSGKKHVIAYSSNYKKESNILELIYHNITSITENFYDNVEVTSSKDYTKIERNKVSDGYLFDILFFGNLFYGYNTGAEMNDDNNTVITSSSIIFDTKNNIINNMTIESMYRSSLNNDTGTALKISIDNIGKCDENIFDSNQKLISELVE